MSSSGVTPEQRGKRLLRATAECSRARKELWARLFEAKRQGRPVVAAVGLLPREIWYAMDVPVLFMENLALHVSARGLSARYCEIAEQQGFARELCAVHLTLLGIAAAETRDPFVDRLFVPPDLVVGSNFPCISESKSFLYWAERFGCPYHVVDVPINTWGNDVSEHAVAYVAGELERMVAFLENHGFVFDPARLSRAVGNARRAMELWGEVEEYRKAAPAPMSAVDGLAGIANILMCLLGSDTAVELFQGMRDELSARVAAGQGVIEQERLRLYLVGVPPLYNLGLLDYPEKYGAVVVKSDLDFLGGSLMDPALLDPQRPFESLARKQVADMVNPCYANKVDDAVRTVREYGMDAVIGLNKRGCRNLPAALRLIKDAVQRETGKPMAIFDLDGIDSREYNDSQVKAHLDVFLETLTGSTCKL